jgi:SAM-dependent methyltransferase
MNWGCGAVARPGWINSDREAGPGVDIARDVRHGLPLDDESLDYITSIHALPEIPYGDLEDVLWELRRVLRRGGVLRLGLPDMDRAIEAYRSGDTDYFLAPDELVRSPGGKMIAQLLWFGRSRTMFTWDFAEELLAKARFREVRRCGYRLTYSSFPEIVELDNRPDESLFVEAVK